MTVASGSVLKSGVASVLCSCGTQATKLLWKLLKTRNLSKDARGSYVLDKELQGVFGRKTLNFRTISKVRHVYEYTHARRSMRVCVVAGGDHLLWCRH